MGATIPRVVKRLKTMINLRAAGFRIAVSCPPPFNKACAFEAFNLAILSDTGLQTRQEKEWINKANEITTPVKSSFCLTDSGPSNTFHSAGQPTDHFWESHQNDSIRI